MSNTFKNTDLVVRDASIMLSDNLVAANLVNRNHEDAFAGKVGATIEIKVVPTQTARDWIDDGATSDNDITETDVDLVLSEQPYVAHTLTSSQKTLDLDDFSVVVTEPAVLAVRDAVDEYILAAGKRGFARNLTGTTGTNPSTHAHILAARKTLQDNQAPQAGRIGILNTTATASFLDLDIFNDRDFGDDKPIALREASMGRLAGIDWYESQNVVVLSRGDVAQATNVYGAGQSGTTLNVDDSGGTSTGSIGIGAQFTIAGLSNTYTVISESNTDIAVSGGAFALTLDQALESAPADDAAITWLAASTGNIVYCKNALGAAIVAPVPLAIGSSSFATNGIGMRFTASTSTSAMSDQVVYDTYCGAIVIVEQAGTVIQG